MDDRQYLRLAVLFGLGLMVCLASTTYLDVPRLFMIHEYGLGIVNSAIPWLAIVGAAVGLAIRRTPTAALIGSLVGLSLGMMLFSGHPIRE